MKPCVYLDENIPAHFETALKNAGFSTYKPKGGAKDELIFTDIITKDKDKDILNCSQAIIKHIKVGARGIITVNSKCEVSWKPI